MHTTGIVFGWIIFGGYLFGVMNFFVKRINRTVIAKLPADAPLKKSFMSLTRAVVGSHIYVPLFLVTVILLHLTVELMHEGFFITGVITAALMLLQIGLGIYGAFFRDRKKGRWLYAHRTVAALLFCAFAVHVATVIVLKP